MRNVARFVACLFCFVLVCLMTLAAQANTGEILANENRIAAGTLANGVLTVDLELRDGRWHAEAENGPRLYVPAFGEAQHPAQIPGPMLRMPEGTTVHVKVSNKLAVKATVYGFNTRPGAAEDKGFDLGAGESRELSFLAGAPGTYFYWARTSEAKLNVAGTTRPVFGDSQLNGAFIVDPAGTVPPDRVFVINAMLSPADVVHPRL